MCAIEGCPFDGDSMESCLNDCVHFGVNGPAGLKFSGVLGFCASNINAVLFATGGSIVARGDDLAVDYEDCAYLFMGAGGPRGHDFAHL